MTESEIAEGVIRTSLPRITDFNCSRVVREEGEISDGRLVLPEKRSREDAPNAVTDSLNASGAIALFSTCKHGLMKLMRKHEGEGLRTFFC